MQPPTNYDDAGLQISVDPDFLYRYATVDLPNSAKAVANFITAITGAWQNLQLGWAGDAAAEAQAEGSKWTTAVQLLFGTEADPQSGAFAQLATAVATASVNYGEAGYISVQMFYSLINGLNAPPGTPPPPARDANDAPVTETAPAPS